MTIASPSHGLLSGEYRPLTLSLMASVGLVSYSNLSVAAALPTIGSDLGNVSLLPWVITVELLAAAVAILGIGPTVDSYGVRSVFRVSMIMFIAFSLLCGASVSMAMLIVFRVGQGIAAGGVLGSTISAIGLGYDSAVRPKVYAAISAVWGVMGIGGPAIAAVLISLFGWRSVFTVTLPVGLAATAAGWNRLPSRRELSTVEKFDKTGLALVAVVAIGLLMAASTGSLFVIGWLAVALLCAVVYVNHARRVQAPVVQLAHLTGRRWRYLHITSTLAVAGGTGASAFLPLFLRGAKGASETEAAFSVVFLVLGWTAGAFVASKLQEKLHAAEVVQRGSFVLITMNVVAAVVAGLDLWLGLLLGAFFFVGAGIGSITTSGLALLQSRANAHEMGRVSSAHQFLRSLGFAYGAAIGGSVIFLVVRLRIGDVEAIRDLLGSEGDLTLNAAAADALREGYVWALVVTSTITMITVASARKLVASIPDH